jgi:hypothetical protein
VIFYRQKFLKLRSFLDIDFHIFERFGQLARLFPLVLNVYTVLYINIFNVCSVLAYPFSLGREILKSRFPTIAIPTFWENI